MNKFNLERYKQGCSVVTKLGLPVKIVATDATKTKDDKGYPIIAIVDYENSIKQFIAYYDYEGHCLSEDQNLDLFITPVIKTGFMNIYKYGHNNIVFDSLDEARKYITVCPDNYIKTVTVTWEE